MITCAAPHSRSPNGRAVDPTEGFFILNRPRSAWRFLLDRSRPDVRMHDAEHCLVPPGVFPSPAGPSPCRDLSCILSSNNLMVGRRTYPDHQLRNETARRIVALRAARNAAFVLPSHGFQQLAPFEALFGW